MCFAATVLWFYVLCGLAATVIASFSLWSLTFRNTFSLSRELQFFELYWTMNDFTVMKQKQIAHGKVTLHSADTLLRKALIPGY